MTNLISKPAIRDYHQIYRLLVKLAKANPDDEETFVEHFTHPKYSGNEWRLRRLGAKYYRGSDHGCGRVDCHPDDYTDEKGILMMHINQYLDHIATFGPESAAQIVESAELPKVQIGSCTVEITC